MPSLWYSSSISVQIRPSATARSDAPLSRTTGKVTSPARRTAAPSTKLSRRSSTTGAPAANAADIDAAPAGSTPTTEVVGERSPSQATAPASSPPPPTGRTTRSGDAPSCITASRTTVPWPAMVRTSSKAGTGTAPVRAASSAAAAAASS